MLKALGISKKKPPSESLINSHREQIRIQDELEPDYTFLQNIVKDMEKAYHSAKGDFMVGRYEELKNMIKHANESFKKRSQLKQERQLARYQSKKEAGKGTSASGLRASAAAFAGQQTKLQEQEKHYTEVSSKELEGEVEELKKDNRQMRQDIKNMADKLDRLAKDYEASKKSNPTKRYELLKDMIKSVTRT